MWPSPPRPTTPTFLPLVTPQWRIGEYVVIPAHRSGAAPGEIEVGRDAQDEAFIDDDAIGVAAVSDASEVLVRGVVGEGQVRAELLKPGLALGAGAVRVDQAADGGEVARLELGNCRADLGDTPDDLMAWDNRVDRGHELAPLVADRMKIGVADAAEQNFDLHVVFGWIATRDCRARQAAMSHWQRSKLLRCT